METYADIIKYYVKRKRKMGWTAATDYWWSASVYKVPEATMSAWYKEARDVWRLGGHYNVFRDCVENEIGYDRVAYRRNRRSNWDRTPQENGSFRKQSHHKKKELSEDQIRKREWRKKVKDPRDQGANICQRQGWTHLQRTANKAERRRTNAKLKSSYFGKHFDGWKICGTNGCYKEYEETDWDNWVNPRRREDLNPWDYY